MAVNVLIFVLVWIGSRGGSRDRVPLHIYTLTSPVFNLKSHPTPFPQHQVPPSLQLVVFVVSISPLGHSSPLQMRFQLL